VGLSGIAKEDTRRGGRTIAAFMTGGEGFLGIKEEISGGGVRKTPPSGVLEETNGEEMGDGSAPTIWEVT